MSKNIEPKPIKYHMSCSCYLYERHLVIRDNRKACPHHEDGIVAQRSRMCLDCDEVLYLSVRGKGPFRCEKHRILENRKRNSRIARKANALKRKKEARVRSEEDKLQRKRAREKKLAVEKAALKKQWSKHWRGDYCRRLPSCLMLPRLNCDKCKEFCAIIPGVDPGKRGLFILRKRRDLGSGKGKI